MQCSQITQLRRSAVDENRIEQLHHVVVNDEEQKPIWMKEWE
ncbi:hypothetical protein [Streptomyces tanashiensis]